jgi:Domain of unknown function (DUF4386)
MTGRLRGRVLGILFLAAFAAYLSGNALMSGPTEGHLAAGALLMLLNSVVVAGIGVLVLPVLTEHGETAAYAYLAARTAEAVLLAVGVVFLLSGAPAGNGYAYQIGMIAGGIGGVVFCGVLLRARLVPRLLAGWGLVGYAALGLGAVLEIAGIPAGLVLSVPGGLFEVALAMILIIRGFPAEPAAPSSAPVSVPTLVAR